MILAAQIKREFASFFYSPIAYVVIAVATIINSFVFMLIVDFLSDPRSPHGAAMQMLFGGTIFYWFVVVGSTPFITMRSIAEEKSLGTIETLLTAPISDTQVVIAKFVSLLLFFAITWIPTLLYPVLIASYSAIDTGPILSGYLGTIGIGMMFMSIGLLCSSLTKNQIVAALIAFGAVLLLFLIGIFEYVMSDVPPDTVRYMNLWTHMEDFGKGIVDSRHLVYYVSVTAFSLFCTVQVVQSRRWRG